MENTDQALGGERERDGESISGKLCQHLRAKRTLGGNKKCSHLRAQVLLGEVKI